MLRRPLLAGIAFGFLRLPVAISTFQTDEDFVSFVYLQCQIEHRQTVDIIDWESVVYSSGSVGVSKLSRNGNVWILAFPKVAVCQNLRMRTMQGDC